MTKGGKYSLEKKQTRTQSKSPVKCFFQTIIYYYLFIYVYISVDNTNPLVRRRQVWFPTRTANVATRPAPQTHWRSNEARSLSSPPPPYGTAWTPVDSDASKVTVSDRMPPSFPTFPLPNILSTPYLIYTIVRYVNNSKEIVKIKYTWTPTYRHNVFLSWIFLA